MHVRKRNGNLEPVNLNKIVASLERYCGDLPGIDVYRIATKTVGGLVDGVSTRELDMFSVRTAKDLIIDDPVYSRVAARILANLIQKEVSGQDIQSFSQSIEAGFAHGIISPETHSLVMANKRKLNSAIKHERDWFMEYHGLQTVYDRYLLKHRTLIASEDGGRRQRAVIETPQYFLLRVACGLAEDAIEAIEFYNLLSSLEYMTSTPTLFNSGTVHSQMSSCYLNSSPLDDLQNIYKRYSDIALLSKFAGGIGVSLSRIRSKGSLIRGTNGTSNGLVPWAHTMSASVASVDQGGRRRGAACVYLETHHPDLLQFLELKDNTGEKEQRAYNLNLANWISDLFMKRVKEDAIWSFFDPTVAPELCDLYGDAYEQRYLELETEEKYVEQVPARQIYSRMMRTLAETGNGWMCFKDASNRRGNQVNDEAGTIIHLSNLCVAPETLVLTNRGHEPIMDLVGGEVIVWNGFEWSKVEVHQTGTDQELLTVEMDNGMQVTCTPYHKFYVVTGYRNEKMREVRAGELQPGDRLIKHDLPVIEGDIEFEHAYTHGFFCGDGTYAFNYAKTELRPILSLYAEKRELVPHLECVSGTGIMDASNRLNYRLPLTLAAKFIVPSASHSLKSRLAWFAGLADADGTICRQNDSFSLQLGSIHLMFLRNVQLMLQTLGVHSRISKMRDAGSVQVRITEKTYVTQPMYRLLLASHGLNRLLDLGIKFHRLVTEVSFPDRSVLRFAKIVRVTNEGRTDDTYCFAEQKRHMGVFNGILMGNCTEVLEVTSSGKHAHLSRNEMAQLSADDIATRNIRVTGFDRKADAFEVIIGSECAVCNLSSINIGRGYIKYGKVDKEKLRKNVAIGVKYLDRVIDRNYYPIPEAEASNKRWRPVGLGLMGLADLFFQLRLPYESHEAIQLSAEIQEEIYYQALRTSCDLAQTLGAHRDFGLTRAAQGHLQFDLAGVTPSDPERWEALRKDILLHGLRNSLMIAVAPTATISHICGAEECIEPIKSNLLKRETLSGEFIAINKYLVDDLRKLGRWNEETITQLKISEGSIANIPNLPPEMYDLYKTVWEMSMKSIIAHGVARGAFIDQSQSLNMFIDLNKYPEERRIGVLSSLYMHAWESGLKTTYYFRSRAATRIEQTTTRLHAVGVPVAPESPEVCESCS